MKNIICLNTDGVDEISKYEDYCLKQCSGDVRDYSQSVLGDLFFSVFKFIFKCLVNISLNPRKGDVGDLSPKEVEEVYAREAESYNSIHHLTTRGQDLAWRRQSGFVVLNYLLQNASNNVKILDICTGTGLTVAEICRIIETIISPSKKYEIRGLDYSLDMLREAKKGSYVGHNVDFVRGDATNLLSPNEGFEKISQNSLDVVTQMFGIGGISEGEKVLEEVLKVLKEGGQYFLADMHRPIKELPGEWFFLGKWLKMPNFEARVYDELTVPLVLARKWAWRDTTALFYKLRFVNYFDEVESKYYSFRVMSFDYQAERWWFSCPIMSVAKILVEKVEISKEEARLRNNFLKKLK